MALYQRKKDRQFVCYLHFIGVDNISLGLHFNWHCPNFEVHLPFCFIRIGWQPVYLRSPDDPHRSFGWTYKR